MLSGDLNKIMNTEDKSKEIEETELNAFSSENKIVIEELSRSKRLIKKAKTIEDQKYETKIFC